MVKTSYASKPWAYRIAQKTMYGREWFLYLILLKPWMGESGFSNAFKTMDGREWFLHLMFLKPWMGEGGFFILMLL